MRIIEKNSDIKRETVRVFFALWPDDRAQKQLAVLAEQLQTKSLCSGRITQAENIHLTLVFLGEVETHRLGALCMAIDGIESFRTRAFDIIIEEVRYWKHNSIVYAATREIPQELIDLVNAVQNVLFAAGFSFERRTYKPHITLMRKASCHALPVLAEPIAWRAREWVLVKSEQTSNGSLYIPIGRWPLKNL